MQGKLKEEEGRVYGKSLYEVVELGLCGRADAGGDVEAGFAKSFMEVCEDFVEVLESLGGGSKLRALLELPQISIEEKQGVLERVYGGRIREELLSLLKVVVLKGAMGLLEVIYEDYRMRVDKRNNVIRGELRVAIKLRDEEVERIEGILSKVEGKRVYLEVKEDESLLGGLVLELEGVRIDLSVRGRLLRIRDKIQEIRLGGAKG